MFLRPCKYCSQKCDGRCDPLMPWGELLNLDNQQHRRCTPVVYAFGVELVKAPGADDVIARPCGWASKSIPRQTAGKAASLMSLQNVTKPPLLNLPSIERQRHEMQRKYTSTLDPFQYHWNSWIANPITGLA